MTTFDVVGGTIQIHVPVGTGAEARRWYTALLGRPPDVRPFEDDSFTEWRFPGFWEVHVVERDPGGSQTAALRLGVADVAAARAAVERLDVEVSAVEELPSVVRWCDLLDPWGNRLGLFQDLARFPPIPPAP